MVFKERRGEQQRFVPVSVQALREIFPLYPEERAFRIKPAVLSEGKLLAVGIFPGAAFTTARSLAGEVEDFVLHDQLLSVYSALFGSPDGQGCIDIAGTNTLILSRAIINRGTGTLVTSEGRNPNIGIVQVNNLHEGTPTYTLSDDINEVKFFWNYKIASKGLTTLANGLEENDPLHNPQAGETLRGILQRGVLLGESSIHAALVSLGFPAVGT